MISLPRLGNSAGYVGWPNYDKVSQCREIRPAALRPDDFSGGFQYAAPDQRYAEYHFDARQDVVE